MFGVVDLIAKLAVGILSYYLKKFARDEQSKRDYIAFVEIMNRKGLTSVQLRMKAKDQVERVKDLWAEDEKAPKSQAESPPGV
jgi:thiamine monophosphate synthase